MIKTHRVVPLLKTVIVLILIVDDVTNYKAAPGRLLLLLGWLTLLKIVFLLIIVIKIGLHYR